METYSPPPRRCPQSHTDRGDPSPSDWARRWARRPAQPSGCAIAEEEGHGRGHAGNLWARIGHAAQLGPLPPPALPLLTCPFLERTTGFEPATLTLAR